MSLKQTLALRAYGLVKIPFLFIASPSVVKLNDKECEAKIPLNFITKNHLGSMYFGVLAMGADLACGLMGMEAIRRSGKKVDLIFKDFKAEFLKRAESDVHFHCRDGKKIQNQVNEAVRKGERVSRTYRILATTPKISGNDPVAKFDLTLSVKVQNKKK